jgi:hypothetical protein
MDFGLSKAFEGEVTTESTGWGSSIYMPPERIRGVGEVIDATSDIYSVGVMTYVMLTGTFPFDIGAMDQLSALKVISTSSVPSVRQSYEYHPEGLDGVIAKAMAKRPADRYQSCEDMAIDLARLLPGAEALLQGDFAITADPHAPKSELTMVATAPLGQTSAARDALAPPRAAEPRRSFPTMWAAILIATVGLGGGGYLYFTGKEDTQKSSGAKVASAPSSVSVTSKTETSLDLLKRDAEAGFVESQFDLAKHYYFGDRVPKNDAEAFKWYLAAAGNGHEKSQFNVALMYQKGIGVDTNILEAEKWFQKSSDQGDVDALFQLYELYRKSNRLDDAIFWIKKAASQNNPKAILLLGELYEQKKDYAKAYEQYIIASDLGLPEADVGIGALYWDSLIGNKDYKEAVKWYTKAANSGDSTAQYNLGVAYLDGKGVGKDRDEALRWFKKSAAQGNPDAKKQVQALQ